MPGVGCPSRLEAGATTFAIHPDPLPRGRWRWGENKRSPLHRRAFLSPSLNPGDHCHLVGLHYASGPGLDLFFLHAARISRQQTAHFSPHPMFVWRDIEKLCFHYILVRHAITVLFCSLPQWRKQQFAPVGSSSRNWVRDERRLATLAHPLSSYLPRSSSASTARQNNPGYLAKYLVLALDGTKSMELFSNMWRRV